MTIKGLPKALDLLAEVSREFNVDVATLAGPSRWSGYREIRQIFAARGRALGIGVVPLAEALKRDHSTISYYLHREVFLQRRLDYRRQRPPEKPRTPEQRYRRKLREAGVQYPEEGMSS